MRTNGKVNPPTEHAIHAENVHPKQGVWQTYDATDGLPDAVWPILQDRKGYLWLGTAAGWVFRDADTTSRRWGSWRCFKATLGRAIFEN